MPKHRALSFILIEDLLKRIARGAALCCSFQDWLQAEVHSEEYASLVLELPGESKP